MDRRTFLKSGAALPAASAVAVSRRCRGVQLGWRALGWMRVEEHTVGRRVKQLALRGTPSRSRLTGVRSEGFLTGHFATAPRALVRPRVWWPYPQTTRGGLRMPAPSTAHTVTT